MEFPKNRSRDLAGMGRLTIDMNANEINRPMEETRTFTKYVGGSPANITIGASRLGLSTGFIGKVADDQMGNFIRGYFEENNINTENVKTDDTGAVTGLAFTEIISPEDCSILLYRDNVADLKISPLEISEEYIKNTSAVMFSGTALAASPSREAVFLAAEYAHKHGTKVLFDIDFRPATWKSKEETATYYNLLAEKSHLIIGTRDEFNMMENMESEMDGSDDKTAAKWFNHSAEIVLIKHGAEGSFAYTKDGDYFTGKTFETEVLKTFGAGDAYASSFVYGLMQGWEVDRAMDFGGASAAIVISRHSCSEAMPNAKEVQEFIDESVRKGTIKS